MKKLILLLLSVLAIGWGQIFYDNFDDGIWDDVWNLSDPSYTIEFDEGADGTDFSLKLIGSSTHYAGLSTSFEPAQPSYISIYIKPQLDRNYANSYFVIGDATVDPLGWENNNRGIFIHVNECPDDDYPSLLMTSNVTGEDYCYGNLAEEWYHLEFKNINFISHTLDWYVNGAIVHESAAFRDNVSSFNQIHLYNYNSSSYQNAWYDEIYVGYDECGAALGDVTGDSEINILDLVQIANLILEVSTPAYECAADYTGDGQVNILDLVQIANYIISTS